MHLRLKDFRSYPQLSLPLPPGITALTGENGAGKTNVLEAIHLCCLGRSHRTSVDRDMIRAGEETCAVHARVERADRCHEVGVRLYAQARRRKLIYVNGKTVSRLGELMGHMTCVMFSPEDLDIVKGQPQERRRFLDMMLSQCQPAYFYSLQTYMTVLKQRNALLRAIGKNMGDARQLPAWDEQLALAAAPVVQARRQAVMQLDALSRGHYAHIGGRKEEVLALAYQGTLQSSTDLVADMALALKDSRPEDIRRQTTSVGPHRDDIAVTLSGQDIRVFGSQGQARTAILSMRLSQIEVLEQAQGETPLLLLDDVLSELDMSRRSRLLQRLNRVQTLLTTTDINDLGGVSPAQVLHVTSGRITPA